MADRIFELESGRGMSFSAAGDSLARRLVILCLPTGVAGNFDPDPLVTETWGVRLLVLDRPGYASSAPMPSGEVQSVQGRADDIAEYIRVSEATAEEVSKADFGKVGVVGWGSGAAYALSFAARHPDMVDLVAIVGAPSPKSLGHHDRLSGWVDDVKVGHGASIEDVSAEVLEHPWNAVPSLGIADDDPALSAIDGLDVRLGRTLGEAATQGAIGVAGDLIALTDTSWADELGSITADTLVLTGENDPVANEKDASWFAKRIPSATVETVADAGHLALATAWERVLGHVAPQHGLLPPEVRRGH